MARVTKTRRKPRSTDPTPRRGPEKERQEKRNLRTEERDQFFALTLDMLCIASGDGFFKWLNPAFTQTLGWTIDELLSHPYTYFIHPDDLNATLQEVDRQMKAGEKVFHFENRYRHKDGSWRILSWKSTPHGELMYAVARDVTERTQLERALQAMNVDLEDRVRSRTAELDGERSFLSTVLDSIQSGVYAADGDGRITLVNRALKQMFGHVRPGLTLEQVNAMNEIYMEDGKTKLSRDETPFGRALRGEVCRDVKLLVIPKGEPARTIIVNAQPMRDSTGNRLGAVASVEDVTERKGIEAQLRRAQKMEAIGQLTGGIAHDFNNLLGVIVGNLDIASERAREHPRLSVPIQAAIEGAEHGAELTKRLLAFSRKQVLKPRPVDLNASLPQLAEMLERTLGEQIAVRLRPGRELWSCVTDPVLVEDAILNLAINARDAMPDGGTITIETSNTPLDRFYASREVEVTPGDYVLLALTDTGSGMPPDVLEHVFEPFFTTKGEERGTGLGLSMVYGFVKQSKGHVKIYSEVGHGTTVRIYLPRAESATFAEAVTAPQPVSVPRGTETVLVVDDNQGMRTVTVNQLSDLGYVTVEAENASAALEALERHPEIALLFSDVIMPGGMNGYELAGEARRRRPGLKVLLTSGYVSQSMFKVPSDLEKLEMINKPFRMRELAFKLRQILGSV